MELTIFVFVTSRFYRPVLYILFVTDKTCLHIFILHQLHSPAGSAVFVKFIAQESIIRQSMHMEQTAGMQITQKE